MIWEWNKKQLNKVVQLHQKPLFKKLLGLRLTGIAPTIKNALDYLILTGVIISTIWLVFGAEKSELVARRGSPGSKKTYEFQCWHNRSESKSNTKFFWGEWRTFGQCSKKGGCICIQASWKGIGDTGYFCKVFVFSRSKAVLSPIPVVVKFFFWKTLRF